MERKYSAKIRLAHFVGGDFDHGFIGFLFGQPTRINSV